ncbi:cell wall protein DAN4-like [Miscanthus floridulus]|uniref:cell wall protein DAN4-like n=1 Tax=Miscanthus floridulus TaxID=154761 RepID=UPI003457DE5B
MSTTSFAWNTARRPNSIPTALPSGAFGSDGKDKPCGPPPGEIGSSPSLISSTMTSRGGATRVTSNATPSIGTGITTNTNAGAAALSAAAPGGTTPRRERSRVGLQVSCTGVRETLNPDIPRPLTESVGKSPSEKAQPAEYRKTIERKTYRKVSGTTLKAGPDVDRPAARGPLPGCDPCPLTLDGGGVIPTGSCPACGSLRPLARDSPTGAVDGASSNCKTRVARAPVYSSDHPDCSTVPTASRASSGYEPGIGTGPIGARVSVRSSDHPARSAVSATGDDGTSDTTEGRGDRVRFAARPPMASAPIARFLDTGTSACRAASYSSPADVTIGSRCSAEVTTTSRLSSSLEKTMSSKSIGLSDASSDSMSLLHSPALTRWATSFFFSSFR